MMMSELQVFRVMSQQSVRLHLTCKGQSQIVKDQKRQVPNFKGLKGVKLGRQVS